MKIYPSILTDSIEEVQHQVDLAKQCSETEVLQIDIVDGFFADNLTVSPQNLLEIDFGGLEIDLHLMVEEPMDMLNEIDPLLDHLPIRAVIGQIEKMTYQDDFISDLKKMGLKAGLSLDLYTPVDSIDSRVLEKLDVLQFMGIEAGFQGQKLNESVIVKIKNFVNEFSLKNRDGLPVEVIFDGGINQQNIKQFLALGISSFAIGSTLWRATDFCEQYQAYLQIGNS